MGRRWGKEEGQNKRAAPFVHLGPPRRAEGSCPCPGAVGRGEEDLGAWCPQVGRAVGTALNVPLTAGSARGHRGQRGGLWHRREVPRVPRGAGGRGK